MTPSTPSVTNQTTMIGPNNPPTRAVPRFWSTNSAAMISSVTGKIACSNFGFSSSRPSTALNTEIAGVIMPSQ